MNRTSLSVIALAVGAVLIIGLYNVYRPQTKSMVDKVFGKVKTSLNSTSMNEHHYDGLNYINHGDGNIEVVSGKLSRTNTDNWHWYSSDNFYHSFLSGNNVPSELRNAKSLKLDDGINITDAHNLNGMFANDTKLQSIDLGNNFDTHNVDNSRWGVRDLFWGDTSLKSINFGSKFKTDQLYPMNVADLFIGDNNLTTLSGNVPNNIRNEYNHNR